jgi:hypothetical protein
VHAVSLTPQAKLNCHATTKSENHRRNGFAMQKMKIASGVNDTVCSMYAVSLTPDARRGLFDEKKTEWRKSRDTVS